MVYCQIYDILGVTGLETKHSWAVEAMESVCEVTFRKKPAGVFARKQPSPLRSQHSVCWQFHDGANVVHQTDRRQSRSKIVWWTAMPAAREPTHRPAEIARRGPIHAGRASFQTAPALASGFGQTHARLQQRLPNSIQILLLAQLLGR